MTSSTLTSVRVNGGVAASTKRSTSFSIASLMSRDTSTGNPDSLQAADVHRHRASGHPSDTDVGPSNNHPSDNDYFPDTKKSRGSPPANKRTESGAVSQRTRPESATSAAHARHCNDAGPGFDKHAGETHRPADREEREADRWRRGSLESDESSEIRRVRSNCGMRNEGQLPRRSPETFSPSSRSPDGSPSEEACYSKQDRSRQISDLFPANVVGCQKKSEPLLRPESLPQSSRLEDRPTGIGSDFSSRGFEREARHATPTRPSAVSLHHNGAREFQFGASDAAAAAAVAAAQRGGLLQRYPGAVQNSFLPGMNQSVMYLRNNVFNEMPPGYHGGGGVRGPPPPHPHDTVPFYTWLLSRHGSAYVNQRFVHPGAPGAAMFFPFRKPKRIRTAFSPAQLLQLEDAFVKNHYVVGQERKTLAASLNLSETQVKVWFQNRRTKHKRVQTDGSSNNGDDNHDDNRSVDDVTDDENTQSNAFDGMSSPDYDSEYVDVDSPPESPCSPRSAAAADQSHRIDDVTTDQSASSCRIDSATTDLSQTTCHVDDIVSTTEMTPNKSVRTFFSSHLVGLNSRTESDRNDPDSVTINNSYPRQIIAQETNQDKSYQELSLLPHISYEQGSRGGMTFQNSVLSSLAAVSYDSSSSSQISSCFVPNFKSAASHSNVYDRRSTHSAHHMHSSSSATATS